MNRFIDLAVAPARCEAAGAARSTARRLAVGVCTVPTGTAAAAAALAARMPASVGRVIGAGDFADPSLADHLAGALPAVLAVALRPRFEWYLCRGAHFHNDAHYGEVLFGAWCVAGPAREIVFPRAGQRCAARPGHWVVFDPFEPHAVLDPGQTCFAPSAYAGAAGSVFLGFEVALTAEARAATGIVAAPAGGTRLGSGIAIHAETGAVADA